mmetsp:Transcript_19049/g.44786  ORF Transcript_19049/g.44786 Transcript_19049/m.44786 type:complete len:301 (+) Transcript_19049:55-957(+)
MGSSVASLPALLVASVASLGSASSEVAGERAAQRLLARATPVSHDGNGLERAPKLDTVLTAKKHDTRCWGEEGRGDIEGFRCLAPGSMIYCSQGKLASTEMACGWQGDCREGILGQGGCDYPLCKFSDAGTRCHHELLFACEKTANHGRSETESVVVGQCNQGQRCKEWSQGHPRRRRRRTQSCFTSKSGEEICSDDPPDPAFAACVPRSAPETDDALHWQLAPNLNGTAVDPVAQPRALAAVAVTPAVGGGTASALLGFILAALVCVVVANAAWLTACRLRCAHLFKVPVLLAVERGQR